MTVYLNSIERKLYEFEVVPVLSIASGIAHILRLVVDQCFKESTNAAKNVTRTFAETKVKNFNHLEKAILTFIPFAGNYFIYQRGMTVSKERSLLNDFLQGKVNFGALPRYLQRDRDVIIKGLKEQDFFQQVDKEFKDDVECVKWALMQSPENMQWASERLRKDRNFVMVAISLTLNPKIIVQHAHPDLLKDPQSAKILCKKYPELIAQFDPKAFIDDQESFLNAFAAKLVTFNDIKDKPLAEIVKLINTIFDGHDYRPFINALFGKEGWNQTLTAQKDLFKSFFKNMSEANLINLYQAKGLNPILKTFLHFCLLQTGSLKKITHENYIHFLTQHIALKINPSSSLYLNAFDHPSVAKSLGLKGPASFQLLKLLLPYNKKGFIKNAIEKSITPQYLKLLSTDEQKELLMLAQVYKCAHLLKLFESKPAPKANPPKAAPKATPKATPKASAKSNYHDFEGFFHSFFGNSSAHQSAKKPSAKVVSNAKPKPIIIPKDLPSQYHDLYKNVMSYDGHKAPYGLFKLDPHKCTKAELDKAWKKMMKILHPDKSVDMPNAVKTELSQIVNNAKDKLEKLIKT